MKEQYIEPELEGNGDGAWTWNEKTKKVEPGREVDGMGRDGPWNGKEMSSKQRVRIGFGRGRNNSKTNRCSWEISQR